VGPLWLDPLREDEDVERLFCLIALVLGVTLLPCFGFRGGGGDSSSESSSSLLPDQQARVTSKACMLEAMSGGKRRHCRGSNQVK